MVRRTPNGFEQFITSLHKAFLFFYLSTLLYSITLYQNVYIVHRDSYIDLYVIENYRFLNSVSGVLKN